MRIIILIFAIGFVAHFGCSSISRKHATETSVDLAPVDHIPNTRPDIEVKELDVREVAIREKMSDFPENESIYLAFGRRDGKWVKPPEDFLKRFDDLDHNLKSVGEAILESGGWYLKNGDSASILEVGINSWIDEELIAVKVARNQSVITSGPNSDCEWCQFYKYKNGKWKFERSDWVPFQ